MKISEELQDLYRNIRTDRWNAGGWKLIADALQQAVGENLKMKFEATNHCITAERKGGGVTAYRTNFDDNDPRHEYSKADWLAEADRLLRGEK